MVGKGSVSHNSRKFNAKNTDPERTPLNISYCNKNIKTVYHHLFDEALQRHNERQTRADRKINDYYEKIRNGKQEKPFHEIILQIGNCDDTGATSEMGDTAKQILDEYYQNFAARNPNLHVFSAHLHMDEATPHLHIDFVPFTTGSKRGLDTRVSLKQALAAQGFKGGSRQETEWNQWVQSEKEQLAIVMERHGIEWEQKGTHEKHLSVLDYKTQERSRELEGKCAEREKDYATLQQVIGNYARASEMLPELAADLAHDPAYQLPEPERLMSARAYRDKLVKPLVARLKNLCKSLLVQYFRLEDLCSRLSRDNERLKSGTRQLTRRNSDLVMENERLRKGNRQLRAESKEYTFLCKALGKERLDHLMQEAREVRKQRSEQVESYDR